MNPESVGVAKEEKEEQSTSSSNISSSSSEASSEEEDSDKDAEGKTNFSTEKKPEDKYLLQQRWLEDEDFSVAQVSYFLRRF